MRNQGFTPQRATVKREAAADPQRLELSRLFIVCGRNRTVDELHSLFSTCGTIRHLHLALDRSKKSRGFAFLQYEDTADAAAAINRLDHLELQDGHILKVTVAKERSAGGKGNLKRGQHARHDFDEKTKEAVKEGDDGIDTRLPGKRQRSSPPVVIASLEVNRVAPMVVVENRGLDELRANVDKVARWEVETTTACQTHPSSVPVCKKGAMEPELESQSIKLMVHSMVHAVEQTEAQNSDSRELLAIYSQRLVACEEDTKPWRSKTLVPRFKRIIEQGLYTESLSSSCRSVSLASTSTKPQKSPFNALLTPTKPARDCGGMPALRFKSNLRRRRQTLNDAGSGAEYESDSSNIRRKRSSMTKSPSSTIKADGRANSHTLLFSPTNLSEVDRSSSCCPMDRSQDNLRGDILSKRLCKRQSSDSAIEESYRLAKQQATQIRRELDGGSADRRLARPTTASETRYFAADRDIKIEPELELAELTRTKLFYTSTYKFTEQELEAMFAIYGDFKSVELVKSFGRVKTMAYIHYVKPCTAAFVVESFKEESSQGNEDPEQIDFMTLSFAHETGGHQLQQQPKPASCQLEKALGCSSNVLPSLISANKAAPSSGGNDHLWVLLMYDRYLATHVVSSVVSSMLGMEFMDVKVIKSTGEAQGVAFVKFDSEANATQAALHLHLMELPLGSGKLLQAIVIQSSSLFTSIHGNNAISTDESMGLNCLADERIATKSSDDVDLHAVEAQFAHLMRSTERIHTSKDQSYHHYSPMSLPRGTALSDHSSRMTAAMYPPTFPGEIYPSVGLEYYPMPFVSYPPPPPFYPYANYRGEHDQQLPHHHHYGGNTSGWMDTASYYPGQYPLSCSPEQGLEFSEYCTKGTRKTHLSSKQRSARFPSVRMDVKDDTSSCSSQAACAIHISTIKPLELVTLASAIQDCSGVVSFAKVAATASDVTGYRVDFTNEAHALEALRKLDNSVCGDQKLRVVKVSSSRHRGGGGNWGKARSGGSSRRKRQRIDLRSRK